MDVKINLVPEEYKPRPPVSMRTVCLVVLVLGLAFGCYQLYSMKSDAEAKAAETQDRIEATQLEAASLSQSAEAAELNKDIKAAEGELNQLGTMVADFEQFSSSIVEWGDIVNRVMVRVPASVYLTSISKNKDGGVQVGGIAATYERVATYITALENDDLFQGVTTTEWDVLAGTFKVSMQTTAGGER
jgi:Tfp pilus assembly protein PilN